MLTVLLIGIGLAMDAFSVSVTNGMCMEKVNLKNNREVNLVIAIPLDKNYDFSKEKLYQNLKYAFLYKNFFFYCAERFVWFV